MTVDIEAIRPVPIHFIKTFCEYRPPLLFPLTSAADRIYFARNFNAVD